MESRFFVLITTFLIASMAAAQTPFSPTGNVTLDDWKDVKHFTPPQFVIDQPLDVQDWNLTGARHANVLMIKKSDLNERIFGGAIQEILDNSAIIPEVRVVTSPGESSWKGGAVSGILTVAAGWWLGSHIRKFLVDRQSFKKVLDTMPSNTKTSLKQYLIDVGSIAGIVGGYSVWHRYFRTPESRYVVLTVSKEQLAGLVRQFSTPYSDETATHD